MTSSALRSFLDRHKFVAASAGAVLIVLIIAASLWTFARPASAQYAMRQKVSVKSDLHFSFPELMDHASVEKEMTRPDLQGEWKWDGEVLVFHPASTLKAGAVYAFHLPKQTLTVEKTALGRDLDFIFTVAGPPKLVAQIPLAKAVDIDPSSKITLVFDRPMIALSQVQGDTADEKLSNWPVTITPSIPGRWRWLSTVAIEFIPSSPLTKNTEYTVHVPKGIETAIGDATEEDFSWTFETVRPQVVSTQPDEGFSYAGPGTPISVYFNEDIDQASAKEHIQLYRLQGTGAFRAVASAKSSPPKDSVTIRSWTYGIITDEDGKKTVDKKSIIVTPQEPLAFKSSYTLSVTPGVKGTEGTLGSRSGSLVHFSTVGDIKVTSATYENGGINVLLSNPVDSGSLKQAMTITPAIEFPADEEKKDVWTVNSWASNAIVAYPPLKPRTKYTVTVGTQLQDQFGQHLGKPYTFDFTTPPVPPKVFIHSKGEFGIFERSKPPVFYINDVNVSAINVGFAKLPLTDFLHLRYRNQYNYEAPQEADLDLTTKEGYASWSLKPGGKNDVWEAIPFDVSKQSGKTLQSGIYAMQVSSPEYVDAAKKTPIISRQLFVLTNLSVTLKYSGDRTLVWVTDMQTGNPVSGAKLTFYAVDGVSHLTGTTDAKGFFESPLPLKDFMVSGFATNPEFWVTAEKGGDFSLVSSMWNEGIQPNNFQYYIDFQGTDSRPYRIDSYVYTERPLYRTGDKVFFKGLVRMRDWHGAMSLPDKDRNVLVRITDETGNQVFSSTLPFSEYGSFTGSFPLDSKAALGYYYLSAQIMPDNDVYGGYMGTSFSVLAYRKPEYLVDLTAAKEDYFNHDKVEADVSGSYYFGAAMAGAKVQWRAETTDYYFNKYSYDDGWYSFADEVFCNMNCDQQTNSIMNGQGTLDASGHLHITVPATIDQKPISQVLSIEADVTDLNNQVVSNRTSVMVHKSDTYVGIRSDDYVVTPGSDASFSVITLKPDGSARPNQSVRVQLYSRTWNSIRKKGVDGEYYYDNEPKDTFVKDITVTTDAKGKAKAKMRIDTGGEFHVIATTKDSAGRESKTGTSVYAWSNNYVNWPHSNTDRLEVVPDKLQYKVGDTAKLLVKSPFQGKGVKALVTVEREELISKQVIDVTSNALPIEIPITKDLLPNAYVSVLIIKPRMGETFDDNGLDTGAPAFRLGYTKLSVDTSSKVIDVSMKTDKEKYAPGETVTVTLATKDAQGKPVSADVSLGTVDMSLLALSGFSEPSLVQYFYSDRGLGLYTAQMLTYLVERFKPGSKGGGGGDPETRKRGDFKDTAYWNPSIVTNAQGTATVSFKLPDNLTTWQMLAIAQSKEHTFGSLAKTFIETKHVILRPVRPRFAVIGDSITLGAVVHNFLDAQQTFTVTLKGKGFSAASDQLIRSVTLKPGEQQKVLFPVKAEAGTGMTLNFTASNGKDRDEIEETIPVYAFGVPQSVSTNGIVESDQAWEKVHAPSVADASSGKMTITVSPSVASFLPKGLEYLVHYPYGCAEQIVSSFLPSIAIMQLQGFDAFHVVDQKRLTDIVSTGFQRLYTFQRPDGGFGYWQDSQYSYPYLTAYVLYAMNTARAGKFAVDEGVARRAQDYLNGVLRSQKPEDKLDLATRAYILFVLSEASGGQQSLLSNIYDQRKNLPLFAQAQLAMSFKNSGDSAKAKGILEEIKNHALVDSRGTHFEEQEGDIYGYLMNTNDRTTATVLQAMIRIDPQYSLIPAVMRYTLSVREDGHWDTTQSTVQSILSLVDYLKSTKELEANYTAQVNVNGKQQLEWKVGKAEVLQKKDVTLALNDLLRGKENDVTLQKTGNGRLYYDMLLSYFYTPASDIPPAEEGMSISRQLKALPGQKKDVTVGNMYQVTLTITVPEDRNFVAVESPLPAGMEIIDTNLQTAQQNLLQPDPMDYWSADYWKNGSWRFSHHEFRDDQVFLFADELPAGVYQYQYLVRATTPGRYHERPARVWEMYFPEIFGQSKGGWFEVKDAQ